MNKFGKPRGLQGNLCANTTPPPPKKGKKNTNTYTFYGCSMAVTSTDPGGLMVLWGGGLCPGAPEGSTGSGSGLKHLRRRSHGLNAHPTDSCTRGSNSRPLSTRRLTYDNGRFSSDWRLHIHFS